MRRGRYAEAVTASTRHRASRRQDSAAYTREAILAAASGLFSSRGYTATTVNEVATLARVAVATVYTSVGGKPTLLRALIERGVNEPRTTQTLAAVASADDPREVIRLTAAGTRHSNEASREMVALMLSTADTVPEIAEAMREAVTAYRQALRAVAGRLEDLSALRRGLDVEQATDMLWYFFGLHSWRQLVQDNSWSYEDAQSWLAECAEAALLPPERTKTNTPR